VTKKTSNTQQVEVTDVYAILGAHASMTDAEIHTLYMRLATVHHPDKGGSADAFARVSAAYAAIKRQPQRSAWAGLAALVHPACPACSGTGATRRQRGFAAVELRHCATCGGSGYRLKH
jgi:DnaJ-class molecular chaperone